MNRTSTNEKIEQRAYELFLERGAEHGHAMDDWLAAERELGNRREQIEAEFVQEPPSKTAPKQEYAAAAGRTGR
jgi:hypothetical protein